MRISVSHTTTYRYEKPLRSVAQALRVTPRDHDGQHVLHWRITPSVDGRLRATEDGFGNIVHQFEAEGPLSELVVHVEGVVETSDTAGVVRGTDEKAPPIVYLRETPGIRLEEPLRAAALAATEGAAGDLDRLHRLLAHLRDAMELEEDPAAPLRTPAAALAAGKGSAVDLAQLFIALARALEIPARFVSGYLAIGPEALRQEAHAWAEAHVEGLGWIGFDPAAGLCTSDAHLRVAVGLDQGDAAPIRGARVGGAGETRSVALRIADLQQ